MLRYFTREGKVTKLLGQLRGIPDLDYTLRRSIEQQLVKIGIPAVDYVVSRLAYSEGEETHSLISVLHKIGLPSLPRLVEEYMLIRKFSPEQEDKTAPLLKTISEVPGAADYLVQGLNIHHRMKNDFQFEFDIASAKYHQADLMCFEGYQCTHVLEVLSSTGWPAVHALVGSYMQARARVFSSKKSNAPFQHWASRSVFLADALRDCLLRLQPVLKLQPLIRNVSDFRLVLFDALGRKQFTEYLETLGDDGRKIVNLLPAELKVGSFNHRTIFCQNCFSWIEAPASPLWDEERLCPTCQGTLSFD